jgi:hypothetical protein
MTYAQLSTLRRQRERTGFVPSTPRLGTHDRRTAIEILQSHQNDLRDDPERLSTEFIVRLANCTSRENKDIIKEIIKDDYRY